MNDRENGPRRALSRAALVALAVFVFAPPALAQRGLPALEGRAVWDGPLAEAPGEVRDALERARAALRDVPPRARGRSAEAMTRWTREALAPWLARRRAALDAIGGLVGPLAQRGGPRERVLASVLIARVADDLITHLDAAPIPEDVARDRELLAAYRGALASATAPLVEEAARAYRACADAAPSAPAPMRAWLSICAERAAALEARAVEIRAMDERARVAADARGEVRSADRVPAGCSGMSTSGPEDGVRPPREGAPRALAIMIEGDDPPATVRRALARALADRFRSRFDALVPHAEVERARRLAREGRWRARGPVCAAPPSAAAVLAEAHPNLVIATARSECRLFADEGEHCTLSLSFERMGTYDRGGLPELHEAYVGTTRSRAAWIAAAGLLAPRIVGGLVGGFEGAVPSPPRDYVEVRQTEDDDPRLRVTSTLWRQHGALRACFRGEGIAAFRVALTLSPTGAAGDVTVTEEPGTLRGDPAAVARVRECVARTIERTPFVCPPDGAPTRVEARLCIGGR